MVRASCANRMMACLTPACCLHLQVDAALSAGQRCLALRTQDNVGPVPSVAILFGSMQGKTVKPGQVDIPGVVRYAHSCCQTQRAVCCAVCSELIRLLCHRYRDHRICPQAALADLAVATFHRGIWPSSLLPPLACRGNSP